MYKLKQVIAGTFFAVILLLTPATAVTVTKGIEGTVILPTSITDLLGTCEGAECPSINIGVLDSQGYPIESRGGTSVTGGSVDFIEGVYQYSLVITDESAYGERYVVAIDIRNGDMGNEILFYDFGSDHAVGTTGDIGTEDSILHEDDAYNNYGSLSVNLVYMNDVDIIQLDINLINKNDGRQKLTGKIKLPEGMVLGPTVDGYDNSLNISIASPGIYGFFETIKNMLIDDGILDTDGLYTFTTSINNESNVSMDLSLAFSAILDGYEIDTFYQIGVDAQDVDDHSIDGDEKLVTGWSPSSNYVTFSTTIIDFGTLDVDAYLVGAKLLTGTLTPPESFPLSSDYPVYNDITLHLESNNNFDFQFLRLLDFDGYSTLNANGAYDYQILIPQDIQGKIAENKLSVIMYFNGSDYTAGVFQNVTAFYDFGDNQQLDDTDHIFEGLCPTDVQPLSLDFSTILPVLDINTSNYVFPVTYKAELTLTLPEGASNPYMAASDRSCEYYASSSSGSSTDNGDGTFTLVSYDIREGHEYGFIVDYTGADYTWYQYLLNDDDGDFTSGGTFLDTYVLDEFTWKPVFDKTYTATANDVVFSLGESTKPTSKVNPSVIMYLLF